MLNKCCFGRHPKRVFKCFVMLLIGWSLATIVHNYYKKFRQLEAEQKVLDDGGKLQSLVDYMAVNVTVRYDVVRNIKGTYQSTITLRNDGNETVGSCCWSIYFTHMRRIQSNFSDIAACGKTNEDGDETLFVDKDRGSPFLAVTHINGYTFRLKPTAVFAGLRPGRAVAARLCGKKWVVSRSEIFPNWYVAGENVAFPFATAQILRTTAGEDLAFVGKFDTDAKVLRSENDRLRPFTAEKRFERNAVTDLKGSPRLIVPTPHTEVFGPLPKELHFVANNWSIMYTRGLENEVDYLKKKLGINNAIEEKTIEAGDECRAHAIVVHLGEITMTTPSPDEAYLMRIDTDGLCISVTGTKAAGVFYGIVSLVSLAKPASDAGEYYFTGTQIVDAPRYGHRGVMVDVARNFQKKEKLIQLMDAMAAYKLNKLHLHLSDDEGWRLEIPGLRELTNYGSTRRHDFWERGYLMPMLGSGPFNSSTGSGYYTLSDYKAILKHAVLRHIEVVPEFDMPGHSHAAINSMRQRYRRLKKERRDGEAEDYLLSDPDDRSLSSSAQFFKDAAINPCMESAYRFAEHIIVTMLDLHKSIMPLKSFHFGGDEVPKDAYVKSPACAKFLDAHPELSGGTKDLKSHFVRRVSSLIAKRGLKVVGWEDAFSNSTGYPVPLSQLGAAKDGVISQAWYNIWERNFSKRAYIYANAGYKVILSPATALYFDNPQEPDPEDWGLHWATRYVDTKRTFYFAPDSLYDNIDYDYWGSPISKTDLCDKKIQCPKLRSPENILGMEAALWSELIRTPDRMDTQLWPRLLAVAERSWHKADWESMDVNCEVFDVTKCDKLKVQREARHLSWTKFANTVGYQELKRLENMAIDYYLHKPGARVVDSKLEVNTFIPGLVVQTSEDNGKTWKDFNPTHNDYHGKLLLATRSFDAKRRSLPVEILIPF